MAGRPKNRTDGKCLKCGENPALVGQSWCTACKTDHQRSRQNIVLEQAEGRGFAWGLDAMAKTLIDEFSRFPGVKVTMDEAARIVGQAPRPKLVRAEKVPTG